MIMRDDSHVLRDLDEAAVHVTYALEKAIIMLSGTIEFTAADAVALCGHIIKKHEMFIDEELLREKWRRQGI
jgi:hypothetical protein